MKLCHLYGKKWLQLEIIKWTKSVLGRQISHLYGFCIYIYIKYKVTHISIMHIHINAQVSLPRWGKGKTREEGAWKRKPGGYGEERAQRTTQTLRMRLYDTWYHISWTHSLKYYLKRKQKISVWLQKQNKIIFNAHAHSARPYLPNSNISFKHKKTWTPLREIHDGERED